MADLTLYGDARWESPWSFHVMVALYELNVKYKLEPLKFPIADDIKAQLRANAYLPLTPCLVNGDFWLTESSAISEYLAETFAPPAHPRIMQATIEERARARQGMSALRTVYMGPPSQRLAASVFMRGAPGPFHPGTLHPRPFDGNRPADL